MTKQKLIRLIGSVALAGAALVLLGFVGKIRNAAPCNGIEIHISSSADYAFVEQSAVERAVALVNGNIVGAPLIDIDLKEIEDKIEELPAVKSAQVYHTIDNVLKVDVVERIPIVRLIDPTGQGCYIDADGNFMPLSPTHIARVLVVTGDFLLDPKKINQRLAVTDTLVRAPMAGLFEFAKQVVADSLWKAQMQHVHYHHSKGIIAIPRVGSHEIYFGKPDALEEKFERLRIFYQYGLNASNWNSYKSINLNYKDQIVCTKK